MNGLEIIVAVHPGPPLGLKWAHGWKNTGCWQNLDSEPKGQRVAFMHDSMKWRYRYCPALTFASQRMFSLPIKNLLARPVGMHANAPDFKVQPDGNQSIWLFGSLLSLNPCISRSTHFPGCDRFPTEPYVCVCVFLCVCERERAQPLFSALWVSVWMDNTAGSLSIYLTSP